MWLGVDWVKENMWRDVQCLAPDFVSLCRGLPHDHILSCLPFSFPNGEGDETIFLRQSSREKMQAWGTKNIKPDDYEVCVYYPGGGVRNIKYMLDWSSEEAWTGIGWSHQHRVDHHSHGGR